MASHRFLLDRKPPTGPKPPSTPLIAIFLIFVTSIPSVEAQQQQSDIVTALLTLQTAVGGKTNSWNISTVPCSWKGIICVEGEVTEIRVPGGSLIGTIPKGVFARLTSLRTLSIHTNALTGPLPSDLSSCVELRYLYLHQNRFEGDISAIKSLENLINLDLSRNGFSSDDISAISSSWNLENLNLASNELSGTIPESFGELRNLRNLLLDNNNFSGDIPDLDLPSLQSFNVSYNNLTGSIPNKLRSFPERSFLGIPSLCGDPLQSCRYEKKKKKLSTRAIIGIIIACIVVFLFLLFFLFFFLLLFCYNKTIKYYTRTT